MTNIYIRFLSNLQDYLGFHYNAYEIRNRMDDTLIFLGIITLIFFPLFWIFSLISDKRIHTTNCNCERTPKL